MRPQFHDAIDLFKGKITVSQISSDFICWECDVQPRSYALNLMEEENFDLLGIRQNGKVLEKVITKEDIIKKIETDGIISKELSLMDLIKKLIDEEKAHYFLKLKGEIKEIVTIGDLQKGPSRLLLYALIMEFEVTCIEFILNTFGSEWRDIINGKVFKKIKKRYKKLKAKDLDIDILHCSFIEDKIKIIKQSEEFEAFCLTCERDEGDVRYILRKLKHLRNNLAHSNHMRVKFENWEELLETIRICLIFTNKMREFIQS